MELVTVLRSNLFDYITPELGLELVALMHHLKIDSFKDLKKEVKVEKQED